MPAFEYQIIRDGEVIKTVYTESEADFWAERLGGRIKQISLL